MSPFHKQMYATHNPFPIKLLGLFSVIEDCRRLLRLLCHPQVAEIKKIHITFPSVPITFLLTVMFLGQDINVCMMKGQTHPSLSSWYHNLLLNYKIKSTIPLQTIGDFFVVSWLGFFELFQKRWVIYIILVSDCEWKRHSLWGKIAAECEGHSDLSTKCPCQISFEQCVLDWLPISKRMPIWQKNEIAISVLWKRIKS